MTERSLEPSSTFSIRTRAVGLLSKVAHDLEIVVEGVEAELDVEGTDWTAKLRFPVRSMRVVGVLKRNDRVDRTVLSQKDRAEIERKLQREVLPFEAIEVEAKGTSQAGGEAAVRARGRTTSVPVRLDTHERGDGGLRVHGEAKLSMRALGLAEVKGPMGVFKVRDDVEVVCDLVVAPV